MSEQIINAKRQDLETVNQATQRLHAATGEASREIGDLEKQTPRRIAEAAKAGGDPLKVGTEAARRLQELKRFRDFASEAHRILDLDAKSITSQIERLEQSGAHKAPGERFRDLLDWIKPVAKLLREKTEHADGHGWKAANAKFTHHQKDFDLLQGKVRQANKLAESLGLRSEFATFLNEAGLDRSGRLLIEA